jgi:hypothetical protein
METREVQNNRLFESPLADQFKENGMTRVVYPYIEDAENPHSCNLGQRFSYCYVPTKEIKLP